MLSGTVNTVQYGRFLYAESMECTATHVAPEFKLAVNDYNMHAAFTESIELCSPAMMCYLLHERGFSPGNQRLLYRLAFMPTSVASAPEQLQCARLLVHAGASVNERFNSHSRIHTPLEACCVEPQSTLLIRLYILHGARMSVDNQYVTYPVWARDLEQERARARVLAIIFLGLKRFRSAPLLRSIDRAIVTLVAKYMFASLYFTHKYPSVSTFRRKKDPRAPGAVLGCICQRRAVTDVWRGAEKTAPSSLANASRQRSPEISTMAMLCDVRSVSMHKPVLASSRSAASVTVAPPPPIHRNLCEGNMNATAPERPSWAFFTTYTGVASRTWRTMCRDAMFASCSSSSWCMCKHMP